MFSRMTQPLEEAKLTKWELISGIIYMSDDGRHIFLYVGDRMGVKLWDREMPNAVNIGRLVSVETLGMKYIKFNGRLYIGNSQEDLENGRG